MHCTVLYKVNFLLSDTGRRSKYLLLMFNSSTCSLLWQKLLCKSAQNDQVWNVKIRFTALTNTEDKCVQCWLNELLIPLFQFSVHIRNMICTEIGKYGLLGAKKSWCKAREAAAALLLVSTPPTMGGGRGGEGCSHPATHQIGRSTISNTSGNSLDLPFNVLRVFWRSVMQCCQWFAPPSCARLDCGHCKSWHFLCCGVCDAAHWCMLARGSLSELSWHLIRQKGVGATLTEGNCTSMIAMIEAQRRIAMIVPNRSN